MKIPWKIYFSEGWRAAEDGVVIAITLVSTLKMGIFKRNLKLYLFINTIKYFKHMVNWNIELRNCHPYTPIYGFSLIDNAWMHSLHMEFLDKSFVYAKLTYLLISWSGWLSLQIEVVQRKFAGTVSSWGSLSVKYFSTKASIFKFKLATPQKNFSIRLRWTLKGGERKA